jgi:hypothetical protein
MKPTLYALAGALAAVLVTTTTALAGSGVGGVFNLGVVNSVNGETKLTGNPGANALLRLTGSGTAATLRADATSGPAINGVSTSGTGQFGQSSTGTGIDGRHSAATGASSGVFGQTNSTDPASAGVTGRNMGGGPGLQALVTSNTVAPLKVNSSARVANLNADQLDGKEATDFTPASQIRASGRVALDDPVAGDPIAAEETLFTVGSLTITAKCWDHDSFGDLDRALVEVSGPAGTSMVGVRSDGTFSFPGLTGFSPINLTAPDLSVTNTVQGAWFVAVAADTGETLSALASGELNDTDGGSADCTFSVTLIGGG